MIVDESILFYAARYALGRKTYAVRDVVENLLNNWDDMTSRTKLAIMEEINKAIQEDRAGMQMDVACWMKIIKRGL